MVQPAIVLPTRSAVIRLATMPSTERYIASFRRILPSFEKTEIDHAVSASGLMLARRPAPDGPNTDQAQLCGPAEVGWSSPRPKGCTLLPSNYLHPLPPIPLPKPRLIERPHAARLLVPRVH